MAALAPLNNPNALEPLHKAGVEEIYVGFHDAAWEARFGSAELNRMSGFGKEANPFDFEEMLGHIAAADALGMRSFVCFNASAYAPDQAAFVERNYLPCLAEARCAGVILSGLALAAPAREAGLGVVMSTMAGIFNETAARFYRDRGATRIILPRDLSSYEIAGIMGAVPELEYEVFLMRNGCMFSDSHCLGRHLAGCPSLCTSLRLGDCRIASLDGDEDFAERARENEWVLNSYYHRRTCGLCALWRFERLGVNAYKIVGRGDDADDLVADAGLVVRNATLARECATEDEYLAKMQRPRHPETLCEYDGLSCYYPELSHATRSR